MVVRKQGLEVHGTKRNLPPFRRREAAEGNARPLRRRLDRQLFNQRRTIFLRHSDTIMKIPMAMPANSIPVGLAKSSEATNHFRL